MRYEEHGGDCCGRRHICDMYDDFETTQDLINFMRDECDLLRDGRNKLTEIVLNQNQRPTKEPMVLAAGFVLAAVWDNCSGSRCYMYLHANDWQAFPNGAPVAVIPPPAPEVRIEYRDPPAPAPRVVLSTFHNVLQTGRGAGFDSYAAARAAAPRARSVDRRDVYASGAIRWTTGVQE